MYETAELLSKNEVRPFCLRCLIAACTIIAVKEELEMKRDVRRMAVTALGCFIFGIGIGLCDHAQLGTDPFTVMLDGMQKNIGLTIGIMNMGVNLCQILFAWCVDKKMISVVSFLAMVCTSIGIDTVGFLFPSLPANELTAFLFLILGELVYASGSALAITPAAGYDPYNAFLLSIQKLTQQRYQVVRWGVELLFLVIGLLMGGLAGIGTLVTFLATGPIVERLLPVFRKRIIFPD